MEEADERKTVKAASGLVFAGTLQTLMGTLAEDFVTDGFGISNDAPAFAAFVGEQIVKYCNGSWELNNQSRLCLVRYKMRMYPNINRIVPILRRIIAGYMGKGREWMRDSYIF